MKGIPELEIGTYEGYMGIKVDLLLINPGNRLEQFANLNELATVAQPLGLAMIAGFIRQYGFSVAIIDAEANFWIPEQTIQEIEKYEPLLIGVSAFTTKMTAAGKIFKLIREKMPGVKTIIGGHHASAIPERTLREEAVDFVIQGEGYYPTLELLTALKKKQNDFNIKGIWYLENNKIVGNGHSEIITNLDELPFAAWDLLQMEKYKTHHWHAWDYNLRQTNFSLLYTSLGCPFNCDYCSVNVVYGKRGSRFRSAARVVKEIELLVDKYKIQHIELIDDTFTINPKRVEEICDQIISHNLGDKINIWCFARTDTVSEHLMSKMKRAGVNWVFMGFESGSEIVLKDVHKKQTVEQIKKATDIVHNAGIHIGGNYVFGLPNDTHETMRITLDLAKELNTEYANFFIHMPYPGTRFHELSKEKGYPLPEKWGQYGFFAPDALPMRNEALSAEDILRFRDNAFKEYFNSEKYQAMVKNKFGQNILDFLKNKVLSKEIKRTRYTK
ncbi:MAG TPA: B12-binding domain-containing radical SAM protein [Elusimicrobia bacterium]|nr:B12-binding domain-containing radical SAM protein [Elusimicrobiota bacterium]